MRTYVLTYTCIYIYGTGKRNRGILSMESRPGRKVHRVHFSISFLPVLLPSSRLFLAAIAWPTARRKGVGWGDMYVLWWTGHTALPHWTTGTRTHLPRIFFVPPLSSRSRTNACTPSQESSAPYNGPKAWRKCVPVNEDKRRRGTAAISRVNY